jgi:hypothetical protein
MNLSPNSPRADKLLTDIDFAEPEFDPHQAVNQAKGY